jgi:hypothetical protein
MSTSLVQTKYIIIGIDPTSGSYVYEQITPNEAAVTNDDVITNPYDMLKDQSPASKKFVKIKVQQSLIEPIESNEQRPSFKLNDKWYTLVLDEKVNHADLDPLKEFVTSEWFHDSTGAEDPFDAFRYFYNHDMVVKNIKYLFRLPDNASNFNQVFVNLKNAIVKGSTINDIRKELAKPYFAVKTVLDMNMNMIKKLDNGEDVTENYFINLNTQRYGYPNINGDKSNIITGLHMLYDIKGYLTYKKCLKPTFLRPIEALHEHIRGRKYFLKNDKLLDTDIGRFEGDIGRIGLTDLTKSPYHFLQEVCDPTMIEFIYLAPPAAVAVAVAGIPAAPAAPTTISTPTLTKEIGIVIGNSTTPDNYELVSQIFKLDKIGQYVFYDLNNQTMYNDMEIRDDAEINTIMSYYTESNETISLYRRINPGTYRDLFLQKFNMDSGIINSIVTMHPGFNYLDQYIIIDDTGTGMTASDDITKNKKINNFVKEYLASKSKNDLDLIVGEKFKAEHSRFGICNFNGELSYFTAAMQLIYDCCPMTTGLLPTMVHGAATTKSTASVKTASQTHKQSLFLFMLLNLQYCVSRICSNIEVILPKDSDSRGKSAIEMMMPVPNGKQINVFSNYKNCVEFIEKYASAFRYIEGDKEDLLYLGDTGDQSKLICNNFISKATNNYYFKEYNENVFKYFKNAIARDVASKKAASPQQIDVVAETLKTELNYATAAVAVVGVGALLIASPTLSAFFIGNAATAGLSTAASTLGAVASAGLSTVASAAATTATAVPAASVLMAGLGINQLAGTGKDMILDRRAYEIAKIESDKLPNAEKEVFKKYEEKHGATPHIIKNKCVETIHKLFGILSAGNNVFIDFMEDTRINTEKQKHFIDAGGNATPPNFVIYVGNLPRQTVTNDTYVTVKCTSSSVFNGVYQKLPNDNYEHTEKSGVLLSYVAASWQLHAIDEDNNPNPNITPVKLADGPKIDLLTQFTVVTGDVVVTAGTPVYVQTFNGINTEPRDVKHVDVPNEYDYSGKKYKKVGTIYKSIYHDHYYKYCTHREYNELFFDCSKENVPDIDARMQRENMFAFVGLYERPELYYSTFFDANHPFLYPDIWKFKGNPNVTKDMNIIEEYKFNK